MWVPAYMGRISDSMPHLWAPLGRELGGDEGGAVLEYRLAYHAPLRLGERFEVISGLAGVGPKVQRFVHVLLGDGGRLCASAEAVGVRMDLEARKSKTLSDADQAAMFEHVVRLPNEQ